MAAESFSAIYRTRVIDARLDELLTELPAILLDGPKAVGKTTTALQRAKTTYRFNREVERDAAEVDLDRLTVGVTPILFDEWHRVPEIWEVVKDAVDAQRSPGRFLLTGSRPLHQSHSGAGRIDSLHLRPLTLFERDASQAQISFADLFKPNFVVDGSSEIDAEGYTDLILASGFPGFQGLSPSALSTSVDSYIDRIVHVDLQEAGVNVRQPQLVLQWLKAYGASIATSASAEKIRDSAHGKGESAPARKTADRYREALIRLRVLEEIPAWMPRHNYLSRLSTSPKRYFADPALAARLVNLSKGRLLDGAPSIAGGANRAFLGQLFESLVATTLLVYADSLGRNVHHFRTWSGEREVDFIVEGPDNTLLAVESKLGESVRAADVKHLTWLADQYPPGTVCPVIINSGKRAYRRKDGVIVIPLSLLGP